MFKLIKNNVLVNKNGLAPICLCMNVLWSSPRFALVSPIHKEEVVGT